MQCFFLACSSKSGTKRTQDKDLEDWMDAKSQKILLISSQAPVKQLKGEGTIHLAEQTEKDGVIALRWLGRQGDVNIVENLENPVTGSSSVSASFQAYTLGFRSLVKDQLLVLSQRIVHQNADGTQMILLPGVPVHQNGDDFRIQMDVNDPIYQLIENISVPKDHISNYFKNETAKDLLKAETQKYCKIDKALLEENASCFVQETETEEDALPKEIVLSDTVGNLYGIRRASGKIFGLIKERNWLYREIVLKPKSAHVGKPDSLMVGLHFGMTGSTFWGADDPPKGNITAAKGIQVFWLDGTVAGTVRKEHLLYREQLQKRASLKCTNLSWNQHRANKDSEDKALESYEKVICYQDKDLTVNQGINEKKEE